MAFAIVTDSSSNLVEEMIDDFGLHVLPLTFMVDGEEYQSYLKGAAHRPQAVLHHDARGQGHHHVAAEPGRVPRRCMRGLLEHGAATCSTSGFSSGLSGTYRGHRPSAAPTWPTAYPAAHGARGGHPGRLRWAKGLLVWHAAQDAPAPAPPSPRCATGWRPTSCIWPTGSPWTTSCSYSAAAASPSTSRLGRHPSEHQAGHARGRRGPPHSAGEGARPQKVAEGAGRSYGADGHLSRRRIRPCSSATATASRTPSTWPTW